MKQILIFGASITHGVGGENGGWADMLKSSWHREMFGDDSKGRIAEVYELGVPGETLQDITGRFEPELKPRIRRGNGPEDVYIIVAAGINDARASDPADNHVRSTDDFAATVHSFIHLARDYAAHIICVGLVPVDDSKTTESQTHFSNDRIRQFEETLQRTCEAEDVHFVPLFNQAPQDWQQHYVWQDGLHPNDAGHEWIRSQVEPKLRELTDAAA